MHQKIELAKRGSGSGIMNWAYEIRNTLVENMCFQIFLYSFYVISIFYNYLWLLWDDCILGNLQFKT